ncbi:hypothetical protein J6590_011258 [Homalodisca vitripennis]|nr:hypothetical protein J6590_011258 [Homalodisca vitripennis]
MNVQEYMTYCLTDTRAHLLNCPDLRDGDAGDLRHLGRHRARKLPKHLCRVRAKPPPTRDPKCLSLHPQLFTIRCGGCTVNVTGLTYESRAFWPDCNRGSVTDQSRGSCNFRPQHVYVQSR